MSNARNLYNNYCTYTNESYAAFEKVVEDAIPILKL